jgi:hypothetical protein
MSTLPPPPMDRYNVHTEEEWARKHDDCGEVGWDGQRWWCMWHIDEAREYARTAVVHRLANGREVYHDSDCSRHPA